MRPYFLSKGQVQTLNLRHLRVALSWSIEYVPFPATLSFGSSSVFWNSQTLMFHGISLTSFSEPFLFTPNAPTTTQSPSQPLGPESPGAASISWLRPEGLRGIYTMETNDHWDYFCLHLPHSGDSISRSLYLDNISETLVELWYYHSGSPNYGFLLNTLRTLFRLEYF